MLRGIDISNHQGENSNFYLNNIIDNVDFVIVKATGGNSFVDWWCDTFVQTIKEYNKPWGFYHFAHDNGDLYTTGYEEALYFYNNCKNYFGEGIPILDWEMNTVSVDWVNEFVRTIHDLTSVWPWIYANPWRFNQGGVEPSCGRWVASYPNVIRPDLYYDPGEPPAADGLICCWQYASDGYVPGYDGNLDINHYFGDRNSWDAYVGKFPQYQEEEGGNAEQEPETHDPETENEAPQETSQEENDEKDTGNKASWRIKSGKIILKDIIFEQIDDTM